MQISQKIVSALMIPALTKEPYWPTAREYLISDILRPSILLP